MPPLTRREKEIVDGVLAAKPSKQMAFELGLTPNTVRVYLSRLFDKLNVSGRMELANLVRENREALKALDGPKPEGTLFDRFLLVAKHIELSGDQQRRVFIALLDK